MGFGLQHWPVRSGKLSKGPLKEGCRVEGHGRAAALSTTALATPGLDDASAFSPLESDCWTKRKEKRQNFPK